MLTQNSPLYKSWSCLLWMHMPKAKCLLSFTGHFKRWLLFFIFFFFFIFSKIQFFYLGFSHTRCLASWILTHVWARGLSLRKLSMRLLLQVPAKKKNNWNKNYLLALLFDPICWRARGTMHFWFTHSSTADRIVTVMARYANMLH